MPPDFGFYDEMTWRDRVWERTVNVWTVFLFPGRWRTRFGNGKAWLEMGWGSPL